jgi:tRNA U54 and U55 pseudouridine synthase Pus10
VNRKQRRAVKKHVGAQAQEKMANQVAQFGKMPEQCQICQKEFDKSNKEMVESWSVVVKQEVVRLFCPDCMNTAKEVVGASNQNNP